jgi:hypothetical protein
MPARQRYRVFGLELDVPCEIEGLVPSPAKSGDAVRIEFGPVPASIADASSAGPYATVNREEYLVDIPGLLRMYMPAEGRFVAEPAAGVELNRCWMFLLGMVPTLAGMRRGMVPLHASSVAVNGGCIAFGGQSGDGKSTLAASMLKLGYHHHADDLCLMETAHTDAVRVSAGVPELKLCYDAAETLEWNGQTIRELPDAGKRLYGIQRSASVADEALPLRGIYVLEFAEQPGDEGIFKVGGLQAMQVLMGALRIGQVTWQMQGNRFLVSLADVAHRVPVYRFVRPRDRSQLMAWSERLAEHDALHHDGNQSMEEKDAAVAR